MAADGPTPDETTNEDDQPARTVDWDNPRVAAILAAAAKCFADKGFSATTLAEIGRELGLRKSIVHYYFASKAALIHEVQSFTYNKYLERVRAAVRVGETDDRQQQAVNALTSLWETMQDNTTTIRLNIEVWSAARRDEELRRRAAALQKDARVFIEGEIAGILGTTPEKFPPIKAQAALVLAVINGLNVANYLEGDDAYTKDAFTFFLYVLRLGIQDYERLQAGSSST